MSKGLKTVQIWFDKEMKEKSVNVDKAYVRKGIIELDSAAKEANLTPLGKLYAYGIALATTYPDRATVAVEPEPFEQDLIVDHSLTDYGADWVVVYFSNHKLNEDLLDVVKSTAEN
jgi:hypothetical protein